ncbi:hypothetical protein [Pseudomonas sp. MWU12-2345]|uniref:hypothetical protein n=1 Tax=Pseudomonas sp. MWU12-2345 TaxID=2928689 RepID=UPI00200E113F|nr:hypothetical protein [Pseudomonas sp. MWU12-2345]
MLATYHINEFPLLAIEPGMQEKLFRIAKNEKNSLSAIKYLNAYLHVTNFRLDAISTLEDIDTVLYGFEGFLIKETEPLTIFVTKLYNKVRKILAEFAGLKIKASNNHKQQKLENRHNTSLKFWEFITKSSSTLKYYEGWYSAARNGKKQFINLIPFYLSYGEKLTDYLLTLVDDVCIRYSHNSCRQRANHLKRIVALLCKLYPTRENLLLLQSGRNVNEFVEILFAQWKSEVIIKELSLEGFYKEWPQALMTIKDILLGTAIMGEPHYPLFSPTYKSSSQKDKTKTLYDKALMDIPLTISDDDALRVFSSGIDEDVNYVQDCCNEARLQAVRDHEETIDKAKNGIVINNFENLKTGRDFTPADVCRTWVEYGYNIADTGIFEAINAGAVKRIIKPLGAFTLIPFMMLLVRHHPFITPSWLLGFELFDKTGRQVNYIQAGLDWIAIGYKPRATGHEEQSVTLTDTTKAIFDEIIEITKPARDFLKSVGNDSYRMLFLSGGRNFGTPIAIQTLSSISNPKHKIPLASTILKRARSDLDKARAKRILEALSLRSLRATVAIQTYVKTLSRIAVTMLLRHAEDSKHLVDEYVPSALIQFMMERWIRLFQNAIIYEAMKDSPYLLASLDFNTQEELDDFLKIHKDNYVIVGKPLPKDNHTSHDYNSDTADRLYIELNLEKIEVLLCIYEIANSALQAGAPITAVAEKWFAIAALIYQAVHLHREGVLQAYCSRSVLTLFSKANPSPYLQEKLKEVIYA